ncbi:hypothetical protein [Mesorhizobium sp. B2-3-6]|uniref:hypothetical protein n=1 Tax=Mesorhizobium sp. B2-3-6 TaxID=2589957 RepID=UPI00112814A4|nr:hypothetical protein [Mesorhizobium sp. B2-3-6]TPM19765.1 hypothetical protein FJ953_15300 [Mesorhizobium sp. B2-3-6]
MPLIEKITLATLICLLFTVVAAWFVTPRRANQIQDIANAEILCLEDAAKHLPPGTPPSVACPSF